MAKVASMEVTGQSGKKYAFDFYPTDTSFKASGAVYVITKRTPRPDGGASHAYIYVGETAVYDPLKKPSLLHRPTVLVPRNFFWDARP